LRNPSAPTSSEPFPDFAQARQQLDAAKQQARDRGEVKSITEILDTIFSK
jgi:hypothetical protein